MNFLESIETIKTKLKDAGRGYFADDILNFQLSGGTGGEVLISVCSKLLDIKKEEPSTYQIIKQEADKLIQYAHSLGMFPRSTL